LVRVHHIDELPPPTPFAADVLAWDDAEIERRAAADPDAGVVPDGFWRDAKWVVPEGFELVTLVLPAHVLAHFRALGADTPAQIAALVTRTVESLTPPATDP
jgi:hypothetical protein